MLLDQLLQTLLDLHHRGKGSTPAIVNSCAPNTTLIVANGAQHHQILRQYKKYNFSIVTLATLQRIRSVDTALIVDNFAIITVLEEAADEIEELKRTISQLTTECQESDEEISRLNAKIATLEAKIEHLQDQAAREDL